MRRLAIALVAVAAILVWSPSTSAETLSKTYQFKQGIALELGTETSDGLRLDNIRFQLPPEVEGRTARTGGLAGALVAVSNAGEAAHKVGIAIALFDAEGVLLGVASGGTKLVPLKSGRQKSYTLIFDHVNERVHRAATFQVTLESR